MYTLTRLLLLCLGAQVWASPLARLLRRRDAPPGPARPYEPYVFAAIPLHAPVPVLRVLTRAAPRDVQAAASALQPRYYPRARPYAEPEPDYGAPPYELGLARPARPGKPRRALAPVLQYATEYEPYGPPPAPSPLTYALAPYEAAYSASQETAYSATQEAAPTVLYARPSPSGGFIYRRLADESAAPKKRAPPKERDPPYIIKIHKYRIVKDDLI